MEGFEKLWLVEVARHGFYCEIYSKKTYGETLKKCFNNEGLVVRFESGGIRGQQARDCNVERE